MSVTSPDRGLRDPVVAELVRRERPDPATFIGKGKLSELVGISKVALLCITLLLLLPPLLLLIDTRLARREP